MHVCAVQASTLVEVTLNSQLVGVFSCPLGQVKKRDLQEHCLPWAEKGDQLLVQVCNRCKLHVYLLAAHGVCIISRWPYSSSRILHLIKYCKQGHVKLCVVNS